MKKFTLIIASAVLAGCSHPLEIAGEGDILSASGDRDCLLEEFAAAQPKCTENTVTGAYAETYYAVPRAGWEFDSWENYCLTATTNECSFSATAGQVFQFWGVAVPPLKAVFTPEAGVDCANIVPGSNFRDEMLCSHNARRGTFPTPTPVPALDDLEWDDALAGIAAGHAAECAWEHNAERSDTYPGYVGENISLFSSGWPVNSLVESALGNWVESEMVNYDYATNTCLAGQCGHYTQVVWRDTERVGCAVHQCATFTNLGSAWDNGYMVVCNYSPGGNYNGQLPY